VSRFPGLGRALAALAIVAFAWSPLAAAKDTVNDVTQLNPIQVEAIVTPTSVEEVRRLVAGHPGPISVGGARHSQGGQIACTGCLFLDMRKLKRVVALDTQHRLITVEAGASWRQIQEAIDPHGLSVAIMQDYANFTVGGTLSVNAHGSYVDAGPVVNSVRSIRIVLADGRLVTASRQDNPDVFFGAIGGYGALGVIVEATLDLSENHRLERTSPRMDVGDYRRFFFGKVEGKPSVVMHSAALYPPDYRIVSADTFIETTKPLTEKARLASRATPTDEQIAMLGFVTDTTLGKWFRARVYDPLHPRESQVGWRNFFASQDANGIEPRSRATSTYVLQEYFIPIDRFDDFVPRMASILNARHANVLNVAIRHSPAETGTLLNWAPREVFCIVLYYEQGTTRADERAVKAWTGLLIQLSLDEGGDYYLPYQIIATPEQFARAYPRSSELFALKRRLDPTYKFHNRLLDAYYRP
jgi:FAD/FMN-containing dehydrogenase